MPSSTTSPALLTTVRGTRSSPSAATEPDAGLVRGQLIGRYIVLETLGAGAMGVVYAAYDPELDRRVAVKVLRPHRDDLASLGRRRLLREAQALARLQNPHVVAVYDAGTSDGQVFLAMELISGQTLQTWLEQPRRQWPEVLHVMTGAARGLAAAHRADLSHRDFKPANVLLGEDGSIKVGDFGLARPVSTDPVANTPTQRTKLDVATRDDPLSRSSAAAGTPSYMAPEVHDNVAADARADQFSFFVTLFEALSGRRPYRAEGQTRLREAKLAGPPDLPGTVPRWLRRTIRRGLSVVPEQRHPDMDAVVAALDAGRRAAHGRWLWFGGLGGVGLLAALVTSEPRSACASAADELGSVWGPASRAEVREALTASRSSFADQTASSVEAELDAYAQAWSQMRVEACEATLVRREQSTKMFDLRLLCLEQRRLELDALVGVLSNADEAVVRRAVDAVAGLEPLTSCGARAGLLGQVEPPDDDAVAQAVEQVRGSLAQVAAYERAGRYELGLEQAKLACADAEGIGYPPLHAEALFRRGRLHERVGKYDAAAADLSQAHYLAAGYRHEVIAAQTATQMVFITGTLLPDSRDAQRWIDQATASVRRVGMGGREEAELWNNIGATRNKQGRFAEALDLFERSVELKVRLLGEDHRDVAVSRGNIAIALEGLGRYAEARRQYERSLAAIERTLGPGHPSAARGMANLAETVALEGNHAEALELHRRALAIKEQTLPPGHPSLAYSLDGVGRGLRNLGRYAEARQFHERGVAVAEAALGPEHPVVGNVLNNLGIVARAVGDLPAAREAHDKTVKIWTAAYGADHPHVAVALTNRGVVAYEEGDVDAAVVLYQRARNIYLEGLGADNPDVALVTGNLARALAKRGEIERARDLFEQTLQILEGTRPPGHADLASIYGYIGELDYDTGDLDSAVPMLERAHEIRSAAPGLPVERAETGFALARALWRTGETERALRLAAQAQQVLRTTDGGAQLSQQIEAWLAAPN